MKPFIRSLFTVSAVICVLAALLVIDPAFTKPVLAHAVLMHSTPEAHSTVDGKHLAINLKFNSKVDGVRSKLVLTLTSDKTLAHPLPLGLLKQTAPQTLTTTADNLAAGAYTLHWLALATDGHISKGDIPFTAL